MVVSLDAIRGAAALLEGKIVRTPSVPSPALSERSGADVVLKLENLQVTGSFKTRGALVKLTTLDEGERKAGVIAASAGNHAQGVAYHAQRLGISATVVMPTGTPFTKIARNQALGAEIVLHGETLAESRDHALRLAETEGRVYVSPYDDEKIITGQGTIGLEMLADDPDLEVLVVPVGGGGLISGIATAAKALKPAIEVVGVEAALFPSMSLALQGKKPEGRGQTIADGIAVKIPGTLTLPIIRELVADIIVVDEPALEEAVQAYVEVQRIVAEGAGAASLAALLGKSSRFAGRKVGLVVSGGNIDSRLLSSILMRGLVREGRLVRLRIQITDAPGVLAKITGMIGACGGNIVEVYHQRLFYDIPVKLADVDVVIETRDPNHVRDIMDRLREAGFPTRLLSGTSEAAER